MRRLLPLALTLLAVSCSSNPPAPIEESLLLADKNRTELEMVLGHYRRLRDPQKLEAARFLVANMSEHGFVRYELTDADGNALGFDARRFANLDAAQRELDRLEALHPGAVVTRVASSHLRVGTFQFFAANVGADYVRRLADYAIERLYPELRDGTDRYMALLEAVIAAHDHVTRHPHTPSNLLGNH